MKAYDPNLIDDRALTIANDIGDMPLYARKNEISRLCGDDIELRKQVNMFLSLFDDDDMDIQSPAIGNITNLGIDPRDMIGLKVKDYKLDSFIDEGGYGYVFKGVHRNDKMGKQKVAIKIIKPMIRNSISYDLIAREADIMLSLYHENIVKVIQLGEVEYKGLKLDCHIMEYVDGISITDFFKSRSSSIKEKVTCIIKLADALHHAHGAGENYSIVHADVKPNNVLVRRNSEPVLLDFSISPRLRKEDGITSQQLSDYLKNHESEYSCPEFLEPDKLTPASDIYSLGLLLKTIITHQSPHNDEKTVSQSGFLNLDFNKYKWCIRDLELIINKATQQDPLLRYQNARDFKEDLKRFIHFDQISMKDNSIVNNIYKKVRNNVALSAFFTLSLFSLFVTSYNNLTAMTKYISYSNHIALNEQYTNKLNKALSPVKLKEILSSDFFNENLIALNERGYYLNDKGFSFSMELGELALKSGYYTHAESAFYKAMTSANNNYEKDLATMRYAKALSQQPNQRAKAKEIAKPFFAEGLNNNFKDKAITEGFIDMFDIAMRYVAEQNDFDLSREELIKKIKRQSLNLSPFHKSVLEYNLLNERYYSFFGDYASISAGQSDQYYSSQISPAMNLLYNDTQAAIKKISGDDRSSDILPDLLMLSARSAFEYRSLDKAVKISQKAIDISKYFWGENSSQITKSYVIDFSINRFIDLDRAIYSAEKALKTNVDYRKNQDKVAVLANYFYLTEAYFNAGLIKEATNIVELAMNSFNNISDEDIPYEDLDSISAIMISYMSNTYFDKTPISLKVAETYKRAILITSKNYSDYTSDYKVALSDLFYEYYNGNSENINDVNAVYLSFKNTSHSSFNESEISLYLASILSKSGHSDLSLVYIRRAEQLIITNSFERSHSIDTMQTYLSIALLYEKIGEKKRAIDALLVVMPIFNTHQEQLADSDFNKRISKLEKKLYIS